MVKILVIDDETGMRRLMRRQLEPLGYTLFDTDDGIHAIDECSRVEPDIVVTDIYMYESDGLKTIQDIRQAYPDVKIIAMSGGGRFSSNDFLSCARALGADATFRKPIPWVEFKDTIAALAQVDVH